MDISTRARRRHSRRTACAAAHCALLLASALAAQAGCVKVNSIERFALNELQSEGYSTTSVKEVSPTAAGLLNLLPGGGNLYIAASTEYDGQWWNFAGNLITWPISILWGVPQASIDADRINRKATADLYLQQGFDGLDRQQGPR